MYSPMTRVKIVSDELKLDLPIGKEAYIIHVNPSLYSAFDYCIRVPSTKKEYWVPARCVVEMRDDDTPEDYTKQVDRVLIDIHLDKRNWEGLRAIVKPEDFKK